MFVIETSHLQKQFGNKLAVADLTLNVREGEVFGFLGPNGAGKSTSIKMLLGLVTPTAGSSLVLGAPPGNVQARAKIGFLPEHFRFHDWLTGREFLHFHGRLYGMSGAALKQRIEVLLERVALVEAGDRKLQQYSKGMLQRIGLAMALLNHPKIVFLDEPTSGLDPLGRLLVRDIIADVRNEGTTVFLNSHLLSEIEVTCNRVVFLKQGNVVREIDLTANNVYVNELEIKLGQVDDAILRGLAEFGHQVQAQGNRIRMNIRDEATLPQLARWLVGQGCEIYHLAAHHPSLEQLFVETMNTKEG
ncbi:MAG: ABC transporter ATP-binding protein [Anaerolineae bacterium]|nr:ABC transporter ATP-binding protein [Anaerolineae bacterium]